MSVGFQAREFTLTQFLDNGKTTPASQNNSDWWVAVVFTSVVGFVLYRDIFTRGHFMVNVLPDVGYSKIGLVCCAVVLLPYLTVQLLLRYPRGLPMVAFTTITGAIALWGIASQSY